ncbi:MAG TPA: AAA family ATPase [Gryllotalpicola sp.]
MSAELAGPPDALAGPDARASVLVLPRITELLDRPAAITVVRGMQGYGKSTHVATWIRSQPGPLRVLWLTATAYTDPAAEIIAEIRKFSGATGTPQSLISQLPADDPQARTGPSRTRAVIVIDNAHHFTDANALQWLIGLVQHGGIRVFLNSRGPHPIQKAAIGRAELVVIPAGLFLFRAEETAALAEAMGVELSLMQLEELHEEFGGWPAAVRLVLDEMDRAVPHASLPLERARRYLRDTVLPGVVSTDILDVTMRFALAEQLSSELIRDLADGQDPNRLIAMIETAGFAEVAERGNEKLFTLPKFVRNTLRDVYNTRHWHQARGLHQRLSDWYVDHPGGDNELFALRHAVAAGDWQRFDRLWPLHGFRLALNLPSEVLALIAKLPEDIAGARPSVLIMHAGLSAALHEPTIDGRWGAALRAYARASARFTPGDLRQMSLHDAFLVATGHIVARHLGIAHADLAAITQAIDAAFARNDPARPVPGSVVSWHHLQRGNMALAELRLEESRRWYLSSWQNRPAASSLSAATVAANTALAHAIGGHHRAARHWLELTEREPMPLSLMPHRPAPGSSLAKAWLALDELSPELDSVMPDFRVDQFAGSEFWPMAAYLRAQYELLTTHPLTALSRLDRAIASHPSPGQGRASGSALLTRARMDLLLASGQAQRAQRLAQEHDGTNHPAVSVPLAWAYLLMGRLPTAQRIADQALWHEQSSDRERIELLLVKAFTSYRMGEQDASAEFTRQAVELHHETGITRPFAYLSTAQRTTLLDAGSLMLCPEIVTRLSRFRAPYPAESPLIMLTPREQQLAMLLSATASRQTMASEMYVSINTVKKQLATLYRKLGVTSRDDALARLAHAGLLPQQRPAVTNEPKA